MKVCAFLQTASGEDKKQYMRDFANGVRRHKDQGVVIDKDKYLPCDIALIFGFYGKNLGHTQEFRKLIYEEHKKLKKQHIFLDADLLRFAGKIKAEKASDPTQHLRVSYNSIFPDKAKYFNEESPPDRWELLCQRKKINIEPYRVDGDHILICMNSGQEARGWSSKGEDTLKWLAETIREIREHSTRPIRVRFHPNEKEHIQRSWPYEKLAKLGDDITFSGGIIGDSPLINQNKTDLIEDCQGAWASVVFTTSASVIPIINGIPVFTNRPDCIAYSIANHRLSDINNPKIISREQWFNNLAYSLWNSEEMRNGVVWARFKKHLNSKGEFAKKAIVKSKAVKATDTLKINAHLRRNRLKRN